MPHDFTSRVSAASRETGSLAIAIERPDAQRSDSQRSESERAADRQQGRESLVQACRAARVCEDLRGRDTRVLDLTGITPIFDYFVITTGTSRRQMHAIAEEADRLLEGAGSARRGVEGYESSSWIVQDYGDVVLHVFTDETRALYDLESLWADAKRVDWKAVLAAESPDEPA
jgi:ribosome-associated protein